MKRKASSDKNLTALGNKVASIPVKPTKPMMFKAKSTTVTHLSRDTSNSVFLVPRHKGSKTATNVSYTHFVTVVSIIEIFSF